nr:MAG TPA_asm: hypothetical protein [Bacteriophage sp.]DAT56861.1 MAG TPA: hypothetical protein [Bacteriophage sp.]
MLLRPLFFRPATSTTTIATTATVFAHSVSNRPSE